MPFRIKNLDHQIEQIARADTYGPGVKKIRAFKGISTLAARIFIAETTNFRRFPSRRVLMAFLGLIPSENSSSDRQKGRKITKIGKRRCRTQLIESVQHYAWKPCVGPQMSHDLSTVDAKSALKCMEHLHKRDRVLILKGKVRQVAITAIA